MIWLTKKQGDGVRCPAYAFCKKGKAVANPHFFLAFAKEVKRLLQIKSMLQHRFNIYFLAAVLPAVGRFTPYLERPCTRFLTPAVSNVPRTI